MNNIGYAFIGTPKGLQTKNGGALDGIDIRRYIDLDGNVIRVDPRTELFAIRKVISNNDVYFFITQYEHAKEMESHRTGTFVGSTIVLKNAIAPAEAILLVLSELMASVKQYISPEKRFMTTLDRIRLPESKRLRKLSTNLQAATVDVEKVTNQNLFIHLRGDNDFREWANFIHQTLHDKAFEPFTTVYASDDRSILEFVKTNKTMRTAALNNHYYTAMEQLEGQYQQTREKVEKENTVLTQLKNEQEQVSKFIEQLIEKREKLLTQYSQTERAIVTNLAKMEKMEKALAKSVKSLQQMQQEADVHYQQSVKTYEQDQAMFQQQIEQLKVTNENIQSEHDALNKDIDQLQQQKLQLQSKNQRLMDDFELIVGNLKKLEQRNQKEVATQQALLEEKQDIERAVQNVKNDYEMLNTALEELKKAQAVVTAVATPISEESVEIVEPEEADTAIELIETVEAEEVMA